MCFVCGPSQQSPIDIVSQHVYETSFSNRRLRIGYSNAVKARVKPKDDDHYLVEYTPSPNQDITVNNKSYCLLQFHFHAYSEHWIDTYQFPMEMHIVNQNPTTGELAVLGIMIESESKKNNVTHSGLITSDPSGDLPFTIKMKPKDWLPKKTDQYFRYEGSLTTPEYDEVVSWLVFANPIILSSAEIRLLRKYFGLSVRVPQPLKRRYVLSNCKSQS